MSCTLLIGLLTIQSSYIENVEHHAPQKAEADTVQFWIRTDKFWRIKTFALDHDVHINHWSGFSGDAIKLAKKNIETHFGDVLAHTYQFEFSECGVTDEVIQAFERAGLAPNFEAKLSNPIFWNPGTYSYRSISTPEDLSEQSK